MPWIYITLIALLFVIIYWGAGEIKDNGDWLDSIEQQTFNREGE